MSTGTLERPKAGARAKGAGKPRRPKVLHYIKTYDLQFAKHTGVEVKALCGLWIDPYQPDGSGAATGRPSGGWRVCKNCLKARARQG